MISKLLVKEGELVHKGQVLVEIDPSVTETNLKSKEKNLELLEIETTRLMALIENKKFIPPSICKDSAVLATQVLIYKTSKLGYEQQHLLIEKTDFTNTATNRISIY
ncbi:biotin/lipoyl-binding protein [Sulfurimonas sp.]|uniref:biotin/lipoyl-binding protein n=1 Tax=Sulfurimonas sp. TaxID=2022749 RepID=UPI002AAFAF8F|nr:biotin/lipoyl-binding protein [Sulfurimonas sp.]